MMTHRDRTGEKGTDGGRIVDQLNTNAGPRWDIDKTAVGFGNLINNVCA